LNGDNFYEKVISKDIENSSITLNASATISLEDNAMVTLKDRSIGRMGTQYTYSELSWPSPPNTFYGNDKNHFKITITNDHPTDSALVSGYLNGWHTDTSLGD